MLVLRAELLNDQLQTNPSDEPYENQTEMMPFFRKVLHLGVILSSVCGGAWKIIEPLFRSKAEIAMQAAGRFESLKRKEQEIERLDRLRNPSNYQGR